MDLHRCRVSARGHAPINALAFSCTAANRDYHGMVNSSPLRLAIGRVNGEIEIWVIESGIWGQEQILQSGHGRSIEGLVWFQGEQMTSSQYSATTVEGSHGPEWGYPTLLSIGYSTMVTAWSLKTGLPVQHIDAEHGTIWCLSAWHTSHISNGKELGSPMIAVGCDDGTVVLLSAMDGTIRFHKRLLGIATSKSLSRVLSLTWLDSTSLIIGQADGRIRFHDLAGRKDQRIAVVTGGARTTAKHISIWSIARLSQTTFATADSSGEIKIWEAPDLNLLQRLGGHTGDAFSLQSNLSGTRLLSGGMDRKTVLYEMSSNQRWVKSAHRRFHQHDVRALASHEFDNSSFAVSGGMDGVAIVIPSDRFSHGRHRRLPAVPQLPCIRFCLAHRLAVMWEKRQVRIWSLSQRARHAHPRCSSIANHRLKLSLTLLGDEHISGADISPDGRLLVVATVSRIRLFRIQPSDAVPGSKLCKQRLDPILSEAGARLVRFSPDSTWLLVVGRDSRLIMTKIAASNHTPYSLVLPDRATDTAVSAGQRGAHHRLSPVVTCAEFAQDSQRLGIGTSSGEIQIWSQGEGPSTCSQEAGKRPADGFNKLLDPRSTEASLAQAHSKLDWGSTVWSTENSCAIKNVGASPLVLVFRQEKQERRSSSRGSTCLGDSDHSTPLLDDYSCSALNLIVFTAKHEIFEFRILTGQLSPWSRAHPPNKIPAALHTVADRVMGCFLESRAEGTRLWAYGSTWVCALMLVDTPEPTVRCETPASSQLNVTQHLKRKRGLLGTPKEQECQPADVPRQSRPDIPRDGFWISHSYRAILGAALLAPAPEDDPMLPDTIVTKGGQPRIVVFENITSRETFGRRFHGKQEWKRD